MSYFVEAAQGPWMSESVQGTRQSGAVTGRMVLKPFLQGSRTSQVVLAPPEWEREVKYVNEFSLFHCFGPLLGLF